MKFFLIFNKAQHPWASFRLFLTKIVSFLISMKQNKKVIKKIKIKQFQTNESRFLTDRLGHYFNPKVTKILLFFDSKIYMKDSQNQNSEVKFSLNFWVENNFPKSTKYFRYKIWNIGNIQTWKSEKIKIQYQSEKLHRWNYLEINLTLPNSKKCRDLKLKLNHNFWLNFNVFKMIFYHEFFLKLWKLNYDSKNR